VDARLARLAKAVDKFVADNQSKRVAAIVVFLAEATDGSRKALADLAEKEKLSIPLVLPTAGPKGPPAYRLHEKADVTVIVARVNRVRANAVLPSPPPADEAAAKAEVDGILAAAQTAVE